MYKVSSNIIIEISKDGLEGYMIMTETDNDEMEIHSEDIINEIKNILKVGVNEKKIRNILMNKIYNKKIPIAKGILPIDEKDGYIKYNFDIEKQRKPKILEDGTVDYRELDILNNVKVGQVLAELMPPTGGKNGLKVTGETIDFKKGKYPNLKYGKNVKLLDNSKSLVSEKDGFVTLLQDKVIVSDIFKVDNVDSEIGNIYFDGSVLVEENLLNDFVIKANGNIQINGLIEGGYVENTGDLIVKRGIQGYNKLVVKTRGDLTTKFIENSRIKSNGHILAEAIMHSQVLSKSSINLIGKKGLIVGGCCKAGKEIRAKNVGSIMETDTILEVGADPELEEKYRILSQKNKELMDNLNKINKSLNFLEKLKRTDKLHDKNKIIYKKLINTKKRVIMKIDSIKGEIKELEKYIKSVSNGIIKISGVVYPGVRIVIGSSNMIVKKELKNCSFYKENGDIKIGTF